VLRVCIGTFGHAGKLGGIVERAQWWVWTVRIETQTNPEGEWSIFRLAGHGELVSIFGVEYRCSATGGGLELSVSQVEYECLWRKHSTCKYSGSKCEEKEDKKIQPIETQAKKFKKKEEGREKRERVGRAAREKNITQT
jgi:hypothetical protein